MHYRARGTTLADGKLADRNGVPRGDVNTSACGSGATPSRWSPAGPGPLTPMMLAGVPEVFARARTKRCVGRVGTATRTCHIASLGWRLERPVWSEAPDCPALGSGTWKGAHVAPWVEPTTPTPACGLAACRSRGTESDPRVRCPLRGERPATCRSTAHSLLRTRAPSRSEPERVRQAIQGGSPQGIFAGWRAATMQQEVGNQRPRESTRKGPSSRENIRNRRSGVWP